MLEVYISWVVAHTPLEVRIWQGVVVSPLSFYSGGVVWFLYSSRKRTLWNFFSPRKKKGRFNRHIRG